MMQCSTKTELCPLFIKAAFTLKSTHIQVLRYGPTNKYGAHMDGLGRVMSVLIYLVGESRAHTFSH